MSLRPRFSLLTLILLTALVAGGVKLWYGPHRVVEERVPGKTLEYTYTRTWNGEKIVDGPSIIRIGEPQSQKYCVGVVCFQQNRRLSFLYLLLQQRRIGGLSSVYDLEVFQKLSISANEQETLRQIVELERRVKDQTLDSEMVWLEFLSENPADEKKEFHQWETIYRSFLKSP
jgi:hypothetical protein